jgi:anhydro-N-acetylmuramic acid kinase
MPLQTAIGCISGTSMDGIDVAMIASDGETQVIAGAGSTYPYAPELRAALIDFIRDPSRAETDPLSALEAAVTAAHADAVEQFMREHAIDRRSVAVVGLHGQTVWHNPARGFTRQLMDGAAAAARLGLPTVTRFRHADVAAGGQGAPLVPLYHRALAAPLAKPVMILNWGGVGNVTYIDDATTLAFDTGPASALIDDWMLRHTGQLFDQGGRMAASGAVDHATVARFLSDPFFALPAPKSLDRQAFKAYAALVDHLSVADGAATLAAMTIESTAAAVAQVPQKPTRWLVAGGGRLNVHLMQGLASRVGGPVDPVDVLGWNGDALEAQCFAYLAIRSARGLVLSLPTTTGVPTPMTGGQINHP